MYLFAFLGIDLLIGQDIINRYDIISLTSSEYKVIEMDVVYSDTNGKYYRHLIYKDSLLVEIKHIDRAGNLFENEYFPAIVRIKYDNYRRVSLISFFNKDDKTSIDNFRLFSSIEYLYNRNNQILIEIYRDKNDNLIQSDINGVIDVYPAIKVYEYKSNEVYITDYNECFKELGTYNSKYFPKYPFISDCKIKLEDK